MEIYPAEAWERLGQLLRQRRPQINPRYRVRRVFAEEHHLTDKTIQEIENAYRQTFTDSMLAAIEVAYRLPAGKIREVLQSPDLKEFPHYEGTGHINLGSGPVPVEIPPGVSLQDVEDWERAIWLVPGLSVEERGLAIAAVRYWRDPKEERNMEQLWLRMLPPMIRRLPELLQQEQDGERGKNGTPRAS